jgi:peptide/nickel transport system substrate-binding protein
MRLNGSRSSGVCVLLALLAGCDRQPAARDRLTIVLTDDILSLDPNQDVEQVTDSVLINAFEPLVGFDEDLQLRTMLAESWEHPEPERWRFHLRKNVRFQDGTPLTAENVRDALLAVKQDTRLDASHFLSEFEEVVAGSGLTLDIVTREPRAILASLPFIYVAKPNAQGGFPPQVGTGPYKVREWEKGRRVVLEPWDGYWGAAPTFAGIVFEPVADARRRVGRLHQGTADIAYRVPPELAVEQPGSGVKFLRRSGLTVSYLGFNLRRKPGNPFLDPKVRRAFHLAIDRHALIERALMGRGSISTQPVAPLIFGYDPGLAPPEYDPEKARRLMAEAGHAKGLKVRLDFSLGRLPSPELLQEALRLIGVEVELNGLDRAAFFSLVEAGHSDFFFAGWDCSTGEASEFYEFLLHTPTGRYGSGNYGGYSSPRVDKIAETNAAILDQLQRRALLQEAAGLVMQDLPILPLFVADIVYGVRSGISFKPRADSEVKLSDVTLAKGSGK